VNKRFTLPFSILFLLISSVLGLSQDGSASRKGPESGVTSSAPRKTVTGGSISAEVKEALSIIESNYASGKKIDYNIVVKSSIDGMLHSLDPHSNYFDAKEFEEFRTDQSSRYFGIGATIGDLSDPAGNIIATYIRATFDGAPAHKAGLMYGDKIIEVNGVSMLGKSYVDVRNALRGPRGTVAKIAVQRHATGKQENISITRDAVSQPSIQEAYMIRPGVGYVAMTGGFNQTTYAEFAEIMRSLKSKGMKQLVLDLKNNGGGLVREAYRVANTFLSRGQLIFSQKGRIEGVSEPYYADNPNPETMPLVVLVNRNSASASEILAGALQDHDRALIVGETSFGKGLVQNPFLLDYGSMLLLTIAKYETPAGRVIQRDYSDGNLYNYYTGNGGWNAANKEDIPTGAATKTDGGRTVYSGGGIKPDVEIKPDTIPIEEARTLQKLNNPIFAFALDVAYGKVPGQEMYRVGRPIKFAYDINASDFPITDKLFNAFRSYAVKNYKYTPAQINKDRKFIERSLRAELVTAAYGMTSSFQVFNEQDTQLQKAIDLLPQARQLAMDSAKNQAASSTRGQRSNDK
jgi:carboxyl-terminal processing protease